MECSQDIVTVASVVIRFLDWYHFFKAALKRNLSPGHVNEDLLQLGLP